MPFKLFTEIPGSTRKHIIEEIIEEVDYDIENSPNNQFGSAESDRDDEDESQESNEINNKDKSAISSNGKEHNNVNQQSHTINKGKNVPYFNEADLGNSGINPKTCTYLIVSTVILNHIQKYWTWST